MSRRKSRIIAFQGLYSWDVGGMDEKDVLELSWINQNPAEKEDDEVSEKSLKLDEEGAAFSRMLIAGTIENIEKIDEKIKSHLTNWDFERVNKVTVAILRMSVYSLMFTKDIEPSIVIDEAIDIAKNYGPDDSYKFVNAILDNIKKDMN
ncbi:transcription antitermination factor NusB [uncultured Treponema sp.]|uniref:transcription antitermination factor NusB n=1 Tax=uncultured Treponema sp. TaxID=162155 RepID=UPI0025D43F7B|nr:transcription antitermination factor NusB [uncultured Treponema sp.]